MATQQKNRLKRYVPTQTGKYYSHNMWFPVEVLDEREVYGGIQHLISPIGGSGQSWVGTGLVMDT